MPRKTKDTNELSEKIEKKATTKAVKKSTSTAKKTTTKATKTTKSKVENAEEKEPKKVSSKKTTKKSTSSDKEKSTKTKTSAKKTTTKKASTTSKASAKEEKAVKSKTTKAITVVEDKPKAVAKVKKTTKAIAVAQDKPKAVAKVKKTTKAIAVAQDKPKAVAKVKKTTKAIAVAQDKPKATTEAKKTSKTKAVKKTSTATKKTTKTTKTATKKTAKNEDSEKALTVTERLKNLYTDDERNRKETVEYYDLPYNYNETVVKILAQTPKKLFVYWDVSMNDVENYKKIFGDNFFNETYPVLIVHNEDKNYSFEIKINDFANSWYIDIENSKCKYSIDYGRKFKTKAEIKDQKEFTENHITLQNDYLFISNSNKIESPNDHILFEKYTMNSTIKYKNVKTNEITTKKLNKLPVFKIIKNIYSAEDGLEGLYNSLYSLNGLSMKNYFDLGNPSSGNPSSGNPTSRFLD